MKVKTKRFMVISLVGSLLLSACGGSGDDTAGQVGSSFQVSPNEAGISSGDVDCPGSPTPLTYAKVADVTVIGGTAPYRVLSPHHQALTFGPPGATAPTHTGEYVVANRNQQFSVFALGCLELEVTVMDDLRRVATVKVTAASGSGD